MNSLDLERVHKGVGDIGKSIGRGTLEPTQNARLLPSDPSIWRRVEDELPQENQVVLVCFKHGSSDSTTRAMAYRICDCRGWHWSTDVVYEEPNWGDIDDIEVTHWMPLPEPPLK